MTTLKESLTHSYRNVFTFTGLASRREFWTYFAVMALLYFVLSIFSPNYFNDTTSITGSLSSMVFGILFLAINARRMHDIDKSGWWVLINFIPVVGFIVWIVWMCTPGTLGANRYGFDPRDNNVIDVTPTVL